MAMSSRLSRPSAADDATPMRTCESRADAGHDFCTADDDSISFSFQALAYDKVVIQLTFTRISFQTTAILTHASGRFQLVHTARNKLQPTQEAHRVPKVSSHITVICTHVKNIAYHVADYFAKNAPNVVATPCHSEMARNITELTYFR